MVELKLVSNFPKEMKINKMSLSFESNSKQTETIPEDFLNV